MIEYRFSNSVDTGAASHEDVLGAYKRARQDASRKTVQSGAVRQEALFFFPREAARGVQFQYKE